MEELIALHDAVKQHPYRVNAEEQYYRDYRELLYKFLDVAYKVMTEKLEYVKRTRILGFYHDFSGAIMCNRTHHIERSIGYIHRFITTGEFKEYATYYSGCNIWKACPRLTIYKYNETEGKYIAQHSLKIIEGCLAEIKEYREKYFNERGKYPEFGMYSDAHLEYFEGLKKWYEEGK
jgi:hypothetical protein